MATCESPSELLVKDPPALRNSGWTAYAPTALITASFLPVMVLFAAALWSRPHYQFFPLLIPGAAALLWNNCGRLGVLRRGNPAGAWALAGLGWALLAAGIAFLTPWFSAVGALVALLGAVYALGGCRLTKAAFPAWALLWLAIPPPRRFDFVMINRLQDVVSRWSSVLLDVFKVFHVMDGNIVQIGSRPLLVDQACSGVYSLFTLLTGTIFYALWVRASIFRAVLLVASSIFWVLFGNVLRIVLVVMLDTKYGIDVVSGWKHTAIGLVMFPVMLGLVVSTDQLVEFGYSVFRLARRSLQSQLGRKSRKAHKPAKAKATAKAASAERSSRSSSSSPSLFDTSSAKRSGSSSGRRSRSRSRSDESRAPLTPRQEREATSPAIPPEMLDEAVETTPIAPEIEEAPTPVPVPVPVVEQPLAPVSDAPVRAERLAPQAPGYELPRVEDDQTVTAPVGRTWVGSWAAAVVFGVLLLPQMAMPKVDWGVMLGNRDLETRFEAMTVDSMPSQVGPFHRLGFNSEHREWDNSWGENSRIWNYRGGRSLGALVSLDYQFVGWHDLTLCYKSRGWQIVGTSVETLPASDKSPDVGPVVTAVFTNPAGRIAYLIFALYDRKSRSIDLPGSQGTIDRLKSRLASWTDKDESAGDGEVLSYQLQALFEYEAPPTEKERATALMFFNEARMRVANQVKGENGKVKP